MAKVVVILLTCAITRLVKADGPSQSPLEVNETVAPTGSESAAALLKALAENEKLKAEIARLQAELQRADGVSTTFGSDNTTDLEAAVQPEVVAGDSSTAKGTYEKLLLACAVLLTTAICALPVISPFKGCCETRLHNVCPAIALLNLAILCVTLSRLDTISVNDVFFSAVSLAEVCIEKTEQCLIGMASIFIMLVLWKFKDRILDALGVENAASIVGEFRDWATCWSMWRFRPIELYIWKVEGLAAASVHKSNDVFIETSLGYNVSMRTRVHPSAGHTCVIKESVQLNFDEFDAEAKLKITVKNQEMVGSSEIASVQLGTAQVRRLEEPLPNSGDVGWAMTTGRVVDTVWAQSRFRALDMVPSGTIFVRFAPVNSDSGQAGFLSCWCPRRPERAERREALLSSS